MGILIDSNVLIDIEREASDIASRVKGREEEEVYVSGVTASELLHGVHRAKSPAIRSKRLAFVEGVLSSMPILEIDLATARCHAELWSTLEKRGQMIGVHDSWLAATCLAHGLTLVADNEREFRRVAGLKVEVWT